MQFFRSLLRKKDGDSSRREGWNISLKTASACVYLRQFYFSRCLNQSTSFLLREGIAPPPFFPFFFFLSSAAWLIIWWAFHVTKSAKVFKGRQIAFVLPQCTSLMSRLMQSRQSKGRGRDVQMGLGVPDTSSSSLGIFASAAFTRKHPCCCAATLADVIILHNPVLRGFS